MFVLACRQCSAQTRPPACSQSPSQPARPPRQLLLRTPGHPLPLTHLPLTHLVQCAAPLPDAAAMKAMEEEECWDVDLEQPPALSPNLSVRRSSMLDLHFHASPAPLWLRLTWRSAYVAAVTMVAVVMPFFSTFVGLVGGLM